MPSEPRPRAAVQPSFRPFREPPIKTLRLGAAAALLPVGCAIHDFGDPASRYYAFPAGTTIVVERPIPIPAGSAHAKLQGGQAVAHAALHRYDPYCELEVDDVRETEQTVRPGRFAVTRIERRQEIGSTGAPLHLAAGPSAGARIDAGHGFGVGARIGQHDNAGGGAFALFGVHFRLRSDAQPNVRELRCNAGWALMPHAVYPTLGEMQRTLGPLLRIETP